MHTVICRHGLYFSGTIGELRTFLQELARYDLSLSSWLKSRLH